MRGDLSITSQSTAYLIGFDNTARMLLMRLSPSFFAVTRSAGTSNVVLEFLGQLRGIVGFTVQSGDDSKRLNLLEPSLDFVLKI